ncbi:hypothetical protein AB0D47_37275 [Streptomyces sp. NPDC048376]|uniref:hypothetical protein n=1 Tax=unclassified Streptomyces TaxID=2593676 RepID=UPI00069BFD79|nr:MULTISPECIES: hypothetical protein [unclassified Streptomyces]MDX3372274.1 hypothetical protein [Streptomyces sp. ME02-6987-2C]MDX3427127.1 hypothetical protein [Streptomyces sp. ME02-6985-2c]
MGELILRLSPDGRPFIYDTDRTAMWIALRQCGGNVRMAAREIAFLWQADETVIRSEIELAVSDWENDGLIMREE